MNDDSIFALTWTWRQKTDLMSLTLHSSTFLKPKLLRFVLVIKSTFLWFPAGW